MVEALQAEIAELQRRLGQNSRNSSLPPSSDSPFDKPLPRSLRRKSGRKPGGQPGHPGSTLSQVAEPDETVVHEPDRCGGCGAGLAGTPQVGLERRQVFDLPPIAVRVIEHQLITRRCGCGITTCGQAPPEVSAPVQYGPRITAIILYLYVGQFLSKKRTAQALAELFGTPVSEGTVATMTARAASDLDRFLDVVRGRIAEAPVAGFDETGLRVRRHPALGALRPHRQIHPDHLPPQTRPPGYRRCRCAQCLPRYRGARRLGAVRHLPRRRASVVLRARPA
jgi:transposase